MAKQFSILRSARRKLKPRHSASWFAAACIGLVWLGAETQKASEDHRLRNELIADVTNLTHLLKADIYRTAVNLDRILRFLRRTHERDGYSSNWPAMVRDEFTSNARSVQIAVIGPDGYMITSSSMLHPTTPVFLGDREHFLALKEGLTDELYISKPVIGRASGKWSVQFARRLKREDGSFGGITVISLDPSAFTADYRDLEVKAGISVALVGLDDVMRAGSGIYANKLGTSLREGSQVLTVESRDKEVDLTKENIDGTLHLVARRRVSEHPLIVIASAPWPMQASGVLESPYRLAALVWTLIILLTLAGSLRRNSAHNKQLSGLAHTDSLTKLPNRLALQKALEAAMRSSHEHAILHLVDLDNFKHVNDTFGHPVGDQLLQAVAERLRASVRSDDRVFRLGGDEFAILQTDAVGEDAASAVASRVCSRIAEPFAIDGRRLQIGASIGIASVDQEKIDPAALLKSADAALYLAKGAGRGRFCFFSPELSAAISARRELARDLESAIEAGQLEVFFQPKVALAEYGRVTGYEALVRWKHSTRGYVSPLEFISIAEEIGAITPLGDWILHRACATVAHYSGTASVAVNCSAAQFASGALVASVKSALQQSGLTPSRLEIELTESMLLRNNGAIIEQLGELKALGVKIALDDFGTGYSSLAYLSNYPIDTLKIDRSFVIELGKTARASAIVKAIVALAESLDMATVAEGIETLEQADAVRSLGCGGAQGYLFGRPAPASELWPQGIKPCEASMAAA